MQTTIRHPRLGEITLSRTRRARRISLSVRPPGRIRLSLPERVSLREAMRFVDSKEEWVLRALEKYAALAPQPVSMPFSTRRHSLWLEPSDTDKIGWRITGERIEVRYPLESNFADEEVQTVIRKAVEEAWRREAKEHLPGRLAELARETGLTFRSMAVRNTVSKWGSCSSRDDISLSLHLMRLPDHLVDYVLIHELCHTVHRNHGPRFHQLLDEKTSGGHRSLQKELKKYHTRW